MLILANLVKTLLR